MARIRSIKPEFWSDYRLARDLTRDERLLYIALWNEADDEGRFLAHPRRLLGVVFPYDDDLSEPFIERSLNRLAETDRLVLYEVEGEPYAQLTKFRNHQRVNRPQPSKLPAPPTVTEFSDDSVNDHGAVTAVLVDVLVGVDGDVTNQPTNQPREEVGGVEVAEEKKLPTPAPDRDALDDTISAIIRTANGAMAKNPAIDQQLFNPILTGHGSRQAVHDWITEGIPIDVITEAVRAAAIRYRPNDEDHQISTMNYFNAPVRKAERQRRAQLDGEDHENHNRGRANGQNRRAPQGSRNHDAEDDYAHLG